MRRLIALVVLLSVASLPTAMANEHRPRPAYFGLGDEVVTPNRGAIRAFIPTGSQSNQCLITFGETNYPLFNPSGFAGAWQSFCAYRQLNGQDGVLVSVFPAIGFPYGLYLSVTVWQEGARYYGTPVFYCGADDPNC